MNQQLVAYIKENPTKTLAEVQAYAEMTQRMISSKTMGLYVDDGLYLAIHEIADGREDTIVFDESGQPTDMMNPHPAKSTCLLIKNTLADGSSDGNDFNFMQGTTKGDGVIRKTEELRDVTLPEYATEIQQLLDTCIWHCNTTTYPFATATQAEFDAAKAELAMTGSVEAHSYTIGGFPTNEPDAFIIKTRELICDVIFDEPVLMDCVVTITPMLLDASTGVYIPESQGDTIRVSKGSQGKSYRIKRSYAARKLKFQAICSHNLPFQVKVAEA